MAKKNKSKTSARKNHRKTTSKAVDESKAGVDKAPKAEVSNEPKAEADNKSKAEAGNKSEAKPGNKTPAGNGHSSASGAGNRNRKRARKKKDPKTAWKIAAVFILVGGILFGLMYWARHTSDSEAAQKTRELLGIQLADQKPLQDPVERSEPEAEIALEPEPWPEAELETEPETTLTDDQEEPPSFAMEEIELSNLEAIDWFTFKNRKDLWPENLKIMVDQDVELIFQDKSFGEMSFQSGQELSVAELSENGYVYGQTGGSKIEIHVSDTNFSDWFEQEHGGRYNLTVPEKERAERIEDYEDELITQLRMWAMRRFETPLIEIAEDKLILRWHLHADEYDGRSYPLEALSVAKEYLKIQAELGGNDNYASCEILHPDTGEIIATNGIFIPRF